MAFNFPWTNKEDLVDEIRAADVNSLASGIQGLAGHVDAGKPTGYANAATADVAISSAGSWYDGASLSLAAGTYLVVGHITLLRSTTTATIYSARISDGTSHYASGGQYMTSVANHITTIPLTALITLTAQTTVSIQATANQTATIKAALVTNGAGKNATQIVALRLA